MKKGPFYDDATGQISLARVLVFVIVFYCIAAMWGKDIPIGWAGLVTALYFGNKGSSTVKEVMNASTNGSVGKPETDN